MLTLSGRSRVVGVIEVADGGTVRYELPAPLGTFVPGGVVRACAEDGGACVDEAAAFVELGPPTRSHQLPQPCLKRVGLSRQCPRGQPLRHRRRVVLPRAASR